MSIISEFKTFASRGNVVDLAVGVIIGAAFGKIVSSLVNDIVMPPIGKLLGNVTFTNLFYALDGKDYVTLAAAKEAGAPVWAYGSFLQACFDFLIIAFTIFLLIKGMNVMKKKEQAAPAPEPEPTNEEVLLAEIRDLLKEKK